MRGDSQRHQGALISRSSGHSSPGSSRAAGLQSMTTVIPPFFNVQQQPPQDEAEVTFGFDRGCGSVEGPPF